MKKSINFIILGVILFVITIIAYIFTQNKAEIPKETIISAVTSQFPIEKSMYTLGDMKLSNPTVYFENDKLIIDADYEFKDRATSELTTGKAKFESELEYKNSNLYLWNFNLKKLITKGRKDTKPDKYALTLISTISYELQYKKPLLYLGNNKKFNSIKSVKIKNNKVLGEK
ncbi:hypothetical protein [Leptotrichia massiliensis]|uniref:hypothetical protein n=1 Tax=Leptotrichia massiliensis TaxID=1852388 RepID=UPI0028EFFECB|nr:hypothetical protein [Leptotrichia massiliensis]